jgi:hypothetical protein
MVTRGVVTPAYQGMPRNEVAPMTVINVDKCEFVSVWYGDAAGRRINEVLLKVGDDYYAPPNALEWTQSVRQVAGWLAKGIRQHLPVDATLAPTDSVQVIQVEEKTSEVPAPTI